MRTDVATRVDVNGIASPDVRLSVAGLIRGRLAALVWFAVMSGCQTAPVLDHADASSTLSGSEDAAGGLEVGPEVSPEVGSEVGPEVGACPAPMPTSPCRTDSDCQNPYLVCEHPTGGIFVCRDADAGADPSCPSPVTLTNVPICPATEPVPYDVCLVRYQIPCAVDTDCGPAGFACQGGRCVGKAASNSCTTTSECPMGWGCVTFCPCPPMEAGKQCEPPFAVVNCPACASGD
jgi:hypothetical protein